VYEKEEERNVKDCGSWRAKSGWWRRWGRRIRKMRRKRRIMLVAFDWQTFNVNHFNDYIAGGFREWGKVDVALFDR